MMDKGRYQPLYSDEDFWCREQFPALRKAFAQQGDKRFNVRSVEDLGFSYMKYLDEKAEGRARAT